MGNHCRVPLLGKDGEVRAFVMFDEADAQWLSQWTWRLVAGSYAGRTEWIRGGGRSQIIFMHRALMGLTRGDPRQVDHVNRDKLDNRRGNLRIVTPAQQSHNRPSPRHARSPYRGVVWIGERQCWQARVRVGGKVHRSPRTRDERQAAEWAREMRARLMTHAED